MKQLILLLCTFLIQNLIAQTNSREWLNLKGDVKSIRQIAYKAIDDTVEMQGSRMDSFEDLIFIYPGAQLLIDNSYIEFTPSGKISKWTEFNWQGNTMGELILKYKKYFMPIEIEVIRAEQELLKAKFYFDSNGLVNCIIIENNKCFIKRDDKSRIIEEKILSNNDTSIIFYEYFDDGIFNLNYNTGYSIITRENRLNKQGDFIFDGRYNFTYIYDNHGNWIEKKCYYGKKLTDKYIRIIIYY